MSGLSISFRDLMEQISKGSESAVETLISQYGGQLCRAVRRRLNHRLRPKYDTSDFVQAVWASFFCGRDQLSRFEHSGELVAFLTTMAQNKVVDECRRRLQTQKMDIRREQPIYTDTSEALPIRSRDPAPSQVAIRNEQWQRMLDSLPKQYRQILELRVNGETHEEIARQLGISDRTVRRVLAKLQVQVGAAS
jgi:RNA polymerase sigma-70 factor, ECF subfamily